MPRYDTLWQRLESSRTGELIKLGEILKLRDPKEKKRDVLIEETSRELRDAAGHFVGNLCRQAHAFPYKQILIDVANKTAPGWTFLAWTKYKLNDRHGEIEIEEEIWRSYEERVKKATENISPEDKEKLRRQTEEELRKRGLSEAIIKNIGAGILGGAAAGMIGPGLAYTIALSTSSGLAWLKLMWIGKASLALILSTSSVVFAFLYIPALAWFLGGTAYRKTIPATLHLILIRKLRELEETLK
jgi:uncharacterized protein YaaW (UPF0174 family)